MIHKFTNRRLAVIAAATVAALALAVVLLQMAGKLDRETEPQPTPPYTLPDTLRVGLLNSPTTYFNYRGAEMGYDFELLQAFAKEKNIKATITTAYNFADLIAMLERGEIDLVASPVPVTAEYNEKLQTCGPTARKTQVVVQPKAKKATDVTELIGRHITVEKDSKFEHRLRNLNSELGGGIVISTLAKDTLVSEDMIKMVATGDIDATIVDSDIAQTNMGDYPALDASLAVSLEQESQWAVALDNEGLANILNKWTRSNSKQEETLRHKYFGTAKLPAGLIEEDEPSIEIPSSRNGGVSPYDEAFRKASSGSRFDWKLVAAVAYVESRFKTNLESWAGAKGIMQIMPNTARAMGVSPSSLTDPETCIRIGVKLLETLDKQLSTRIPDKNARIDFVLAAYNAGLGHIYDAIALADKYGLDKNHWKGGVEQAALMKSRPQYYRDPVVKNGYFRGRETTDFVERVNAAYHTFRNKK